MGCVCVYDITCEKIIARLFILIVTMSYNNYLRGVETHFSKLSFILILLMRKIDKIKYSALRCISTTVMFRIYVFSFSLTADVARKSIEFGFTGRTID